jgi:predicted choloylglycine hydrolase
MRFSSAKGAMVMKRRSFLKAGAVAAASLAAKSLWSSKVFPEPAKRSGQLTVLELTGPPRQRGRIHGEELRSKIRELLGRMKENIGKSFGLDPDEYIKEFVANTDFVEAIERWTPGLLDEVKGIAEGSGNDFQTIYYYQMGDEDIWYARNKKYGITLEDANRCSSLGVFNQEGLPTMVAQNQDMPSYVHGHETLLHIKYPNSDLETYFWTFSGLIAIVGMNNHSVGICANTLLDLNQCIDGLPVAFVQRGLAEQRSFEDAVRFAKTVKHASGQNYVIGGQKNLINLECSANGAVQYIPYEGATRVYHTNHALASDDQSIFQKLLEKIPAESMKRGMANTKARLAALERRLSDESKRIDLEAIKKTLCSRDDPDNPVCRDLVPGRGLTFGSMIYELSDSPVLHLAPGPPCTTEFKTYTF